MIAQGVGPDCIVALLDERGLDFLAALLAIFKAGAAYLPLDPAYPDRRAAQALDELLVEWLLFGPDQRERAEAIAAEVLAHKPRLLDLLVLEAREKRRDNPSRRHGPQNLAVVIFTSGSTGRPKGAMVEHRGMFNNLTTKVATLGLSAQDVIAQTASQCFDISVWQFLTALTLGARVEVFSDAITRDPGLLLAKIRARGVTILEAVPSMIRALLEMSDPAEPLRTLRWLLPTGEALPPDLCGRFMAQYPHVRVLNAYGPAECSDDVCYHPITAPTPDDVASMPIGRPVKNTQIYLLDRHLDLAPIGVAGEICVAGLQVGRGYARAPDLTAERFVPNPFGWEGERLYRTGDLGRYREDGVIEFLGRIDHQVKIRGFRIELGEIEAALARLTQVREAVVIAGEEEQRSGKRLVAYVTTRDNSALDVAALRAALQAELPDYMVPSAFVALEKMPLTPNGKIDRKALPTPDVGAQFSPRYVAPRDAFEETICRIWAEVLGLERVGIEDDFFELGGHSLLAVTLIERLRLEGLASTVRTLFAHPTPLGLSAAIGVGETIAVPPNLVPVRCASIKPEMLTLAALSQEDIDRIVESVPGGAANVQDIYPLAPLQEGILFHHLMAQKGDIYLTPVLQAFEKRAELDLFLEALQAAIARHDILRTAVLWDGLPEPMQVVWREARFLVEEVALDPHGGDAGEELRARFDSRRWRLDLSQAPMMRGFAAFDAANRRWLLLLLEHHLMSDHMTLEIILDEVRSQGVERLADLPAPPAFRDFVALARLRTNRAEHEAYFRNLLGDVEEPTAPFGLLDVQDDGFGVAEATRDLDMAVSRRIRTRARALRVSAASLFHAAFDRVVARASGRDDVVFGTVLFGRMHGGAGADQAIGLYMNTLPTRACLGEQSVEAGVRAMQAMLTDLLRHEHASLALAQRCSGVAAPTPLFSALLNYRHTPLDSPRRTSIRGRRESAARFFLSKSARTTLLRCRLTITARGLVLRRRRRLRFGRSGSTPIWLSRWSSWSRRWRRSRMRRCARSRSCQRRNAGRSSSIGTRALRPIRKTSACTNCSRRRSRPRPRGSPSSSKRRR